MIGLAAKELKIEAGRAVADLRRILDDKSVDAVIVAVVDDQLSAPM